MGLIGLMGNITKGAIAGVAMATVLPVAGAVGSITATGVAVSSVIGGAAGVYDHVSEEKQK